MNRVTIIDSAVANLKSVARAFQACGINTTVSSDPKIIAKAERLVLPGVGAFKDAMISLNQGHLLDVLQEYTHNKKPLLGICLGMQLLFDNSDEFSLNDGLGFIPGIVRLIQPKHMPPSTPLSSSSLKYKIPHIGWNQLYTDNHQQQHWHGTLLQNTRLGASVYFVHSYQAYPLHPEHVLAYTIYGDTQIPAVVVHDNIMGCQFHPEKSGPVGLTMIKQFCTL